jgi:GH15 family glucan-1,4-alpha-glucosidase
VRVEDYALIGDCQTAALVARDGSIDWLCWPRFDSAACFAALLGTREHGRWRIGPADPNARVRRRYREDTLVLETEYECGDGAVTLTDFMPVREWESDLVRIVSGRRGRVAMELDLVLRFDYGSAVPWVTRLPGNRGIRAVAGPDMAVLRSPVPLHGEGLATRARFEVGAGDSVPFVLACSPSHLPVPQPIEPAGALAQTEAFWRQWSARCDVGGEWSQAVRRSLITLKALTYAPTGGIVAASTTSLPEQLGGVRNWDYRFCWLRDATLTLLALMNGGHRDEASAWREWLVRAVAGSPAQMQIMYGIAGERRLPESELTWLPGYEGSRPVRIGNAAAGQLQLDVFGEVMDALHQSCKAGLDSDAATWNVQRALLDYLAGAWERPDHGIWEVRGPPRHFTHSKVMCWVAFDRAVKAVEQFGRTGPVERWRALRERIHADVCRNGYSTRAGSFVQSYGSEALDASLLLIPITGFLRPDDPRVRSTVEAVRQHLTVDGLLLRYRTGETDDGLPPGEGVFLACSFWLVDNLCMEGRITEARSLLERLLALRNDVGLLAEQYDPRSGRLVGNFPQAFSHVALVNAAMGLTTHAAKPAEQRAAA